MRKVLSLFFVVLFSMSMWADITYSGGYIYFCDDLNESVNAGVMMICARQSSWTGVGEMNEIEHTKLFYAENPEGSGWTGVLGWVVMSDATKWDNNDFDGWNQATWCSDWNTYGFNSGSTYLIVPSSTEKSQSVTTTYYSGGYSDLNNAQTVYKHTSSDGTTYSALELNSGTVTISAYQLTSNGVVSNEDNSATINEAAVTSASKDAAYSGEVTLTATAASGYEFVGWFEENGTEISKDTPYTYNAPNEAKSVYARFKATGATALDEATDSKKAVKRIVDGQLVIEREGKLYNALGAEVK